ncbi:hypothetical protein JTB14_015018 [Gonioctena quinquepunctata]|nr:hypothetical protein JTB14_015018 [Gonioctena quinquepunctata]
MASEPENVAENQTNFESAYVDDSKVPRENLIGDNQISNDNMDSEERSTTPEIKTPKKSRRLPPKSTQELEISQKSKEEDTKDKPSKKVIIKRHTVDEKTSGNVEKREVQQRSPSRKSSTSEENVEKRRRLSSQSEEKPNTEEAKETMKVKVKLIRHLSQPNPGQENAIPLKTHKQSWGKSSWLDNISATMYKIDVDTIKIVCPSVEFLKENEVKLDLVPRERVKSESEFVKRKLSIDKSEEEPEKYEKQVPEESTDEQKIDSNPNIIAINRKISIVDDTASKLKPPPSPARNPRSEILYITNLVRPFTVKQLKELLERTGKIREDGFWTDRIKSKCYAHYESEEEAEATRNALHGINWPIGNGKQLVIDYATTEDMEKAKKPVPLPAAPVVPDKIPEKENREPEKLDNRHREREREERKRHTPPREWISGKEEAHRRHSRSRSRSRDRERIRKHSHRSYTPEIVNKKKPRKIEEPVPQKLMDDLFLKTKATPSIYWQPLTPEEIATKQQQRLVRMEQFKRRIEETRGRMRDVRRAPFRRR